jgi:hypothetical protein
LGFISQNKTRPAFQGFAYAIDVPGSAINNLFLRLNDLYNFFTPPRRVEKPFDKQLRLVLHQIV